MIYPVLDGEVLIPMVDISLDYSDLHENKGRRQERCWRWREKAKNHWNAEGRNLDESISNLGERTQEYGTEIQSMITLLETYATYDALPEGKNKMMIYLEMNAWRSECRKS